VPNESIPAFDLYAELGVPTGAGRDEIELAFHVMAKRHHPDTSAYPASATARMTRLNVARAWLLDPARRARYDEVRGVRHGPQVVLPSIDPLGAWPGATPPSSDPANGRPSPNAAGLWGTIALIAMMALIGSVLLGTGSFLGAAVALLSSVILLFVGLRGSSGGSSRHHATDGWARGRPGDPLDERAALSSMQSACRRSGDRAGEGSRADPDREDSEDRRDRHADRDVRVGPVAVE